MVQLYPQVWIDSHVVRPDRPLPRVIVGEPAEFYGRSRGTVWDDGTEFAVHFVKAQVDGGAEEFCRPTGPFGSYKQWAHTLVFVSAGRHVVRAWCYDAQGNEAEAKVTVEAVVTPPSLYVVDVPSRVGMSRFSVSVATSLDADAVSFALDGGGAVAGTFDPAAQRWRHTVQLPSSEVPAGGRQHTLVVRAVNGSGAASTATRQVLAVDHTAPLLSFTPAESTRLNGTEQGAGCPVVISVGDPSDGDRLSSGIGSVRCGLDGDLVDLAPDDAARTTWRTVLDVPARGTHSVDVQVRDVQGNVTEERHRVLVVLPLTVPSIDPSTYLDDLLTFASRRLRDEPGRSQIGAGRLAELLCQPFPRLASASAASTRRPVHTLRLVAEVLVEHLRPGRPAALASWSLDEGSGSVARDAVGGHDGRVVGAAWGAGRDGRPALHFDGAGAHVALADADPDLRVVRHLTLSAWIRPEGPGGDPVQGGVIVNKEGEYELARFADGTLRWALANSRPGWDWVNTGRVVPQGRWSHVALVYDGRRVCTYLDGARCHTAEAGGDLGDADSGRDELWIGARQYDVGGFNQGFTGAIADVAVLDRALPAWDVCVLAEQAPDAAQTWSDTVTVSEPDPPGPPRPGEPHGLRLPGASAPLRRYVYQLPGRPLALGRGDRLRLTASRPPRSPLTSLALQLRDEDGEVRVLVWGPRRQLGTVLDVPGRVYLGPVPEGESLRLEVPARLAALERRVVTEVVLVANGDVLPGELGRVPWWQAGDLAADLARYRAATYDAVLGGYGSSFAELRLVRGAGDPDRQALSDRLGIGVAELSQLPAADADLTDETLARLWGIPSPDSDPLAPVGSEGLVVEWQKAVLLGRWRDEDHPPGAVLGDELLVLDPDLVEQSWLGAQALAGDPGRLLRERRSWTAAEHARLTALAGSGTTASVVDRLVAAVLPDLHLDDLGRRLGEGEDVAPLLSAHHLTAPAFSRLVELRGVAAAGPLLPSELDEVADILVQVGKGSRRQAWSDAERDAGTVIGPDLFALAVEAQDPRPSWRAPWRHWQRLRDRVGARRAEVAACAAAAQRAREAAEDAGLPLLRDVLVRAVTGARPPIPAQEVDGLSRRLLVDVDTGAGLWTTRTAQAADTLQRALFGVRTERLAALPPTPWSDDASRLRLDLRPGYGLAQFDQEWPWMGSYDRWAAAISLLLFPGSALEPAQWATRPQSTAPFRVLAVRLDDQPQTAASAREAVAEYWTGSSSSPGVSSGLTADADYQQLQRLSPGFVLTEQLSDVQREALTAMEGTLFSGRSIAAVPPWMLEVFLLVPLMVARALQTSGQFLPALDWLRLVYDPSRPEPMRAVCAGLPAAAVEPPPLRPDEWLTESELDPYVYAAQRPSAYLRATILLIAGCLLDYADSQFAADSSESRSRAQDLYDAAVELLGAAALPSPEARPADAALEALRRRASVNRLKLRQRRNLAGLQRPATGEDGQPGHGVVVSPTNYRYSFLVARAQQLVASAAQVEAAYLRALEQTDAEAYTLLRARQDLQLAEQRVVVQRLQAAAAQDEVEVTVEQRDRARTQVDTYADWLARGLNSHEQDMLAGYREAAGYRVDAAFAEADMTASSVFNALGSFVSNPWGGFLNFVGSGLASVFAGERATALAALARTEAKAQRSAFMAQYERRRQEWTLQWRVAEADHAAALALVAVAQQRAAVAETEAAIADLQQSHATSVVEFLASKTTNVDLYRWMSRMLRDVYRQMLQQATAVARLAEQQLAFERGEPPPRCIGVEYWTGDGRSAPAAGGLTGSARLLADLARLDQHAFETNHRKLALTHTISFARSFPVDLQRFRQTGVLPFITRLSDFDAGFPGHHLRTIRRVRVSVLGLVPPAVGIRATLRTSGVSRVVVAGDALVDLTVTRPPQEVALTSPVNATGVFDLDTQPELLLPFEGMGVEASWELSLPARSNPFDLRTIGDVIVAIDYTALADDALRRTVQQSLPRRESGQRAVSLRDDFPDLWYDLHRSAGGGSGPLFFELRAEHFPQHLVPPLALQEVTLYVVQRSGTPVSLTVVDLGVQSSRGRWDGGAAVVRHDLAGTRWGSWHGLRGADPVGRWSLRIGTDPQTRATVASGVLDDLVLAFSYSAGLPPWPR